MIDPDGMAARYSWARGRYEDGGKEVSFEEAVASVEGNGCPPNCPRGVTKSDATSVDSKAAPQLSDGSIQLTYREQGVIKDGSSKPLPHEQALINGVKLGLDLASNEIILAKYLVKSAILGSVVLKGAAKTVARFYRGAKTLQVT